MRLLEFGSLMSQSSKMSRRKPLRVFVGIHEISNNIYEISNALREHGCYVESMSFGSNFYGSNRYDHNFTHSEFRPDKETGIRRKFLKRYLRLKKISVMTNMLFRIIFRFDVCIFVWTNTFWPLGMDLFLLRLFGKKVIVFNCGSDVRFEPLQLAIDRELFGIDMFSRMIEQNINGYFSDMPSIFRRTFYRQKIEELSGCLIVSMRNQATFMKKPVVFLRVPNRRLIDRPKRTNDRPLIIHAPSLRSVKGTDYVLDAIDLLRNEELKFDFELIEGRENSYVLSRLKAADIVVDQPSSWLARLGVEAMAAGCVVVGGNRPDYEEVKDEAPVIQFEPDARALADALRRLITDPAGREDLMMRSYQYWEEKYSYEAFGRYFDSILDGTAPMVNPLEGHKELLLRHAMSNWQRLAIRAFY